MSIQHSLHHWQWAYTHTSALKLEKVKRIIYRKIWLSSEYSKTRLSYIFSIRKVWKRPQQVQGSWYHYKKIESLSFYWQVVAHMKHMLCIKRQHIKHCELYVVQHKRLQKSFWKEASGRNILLKRSSCQIDCPHFNVCTECAKNWSVV